MSEKHGVSFHTSLGALPAPADGMNRLALISGRTVDNPRLLGEAIKVSSSRSSFLCDHRYFYILCQINKPSICNRHYCVANRLVAVPFTLKSQVHQL